MPISKIPSTPDGFQVIVPIVGILDHDQPGDAVIKQPSGGLVQLTREQVHAVALCGHRQYCNCESSFNQLLLLRASLELLPQHMVDAIDEANMDVIFLIDSPGGLVGIDRHWCDFTDQLCGQGKAIRALVTGEASSVAAVFFKSAIDGRTALPGSRFTFHARRSFDMSGNLLPPDPEIIRVDTQQDVNFMLNHMKGEPAENEKARVRWEAAINDGDNSYNEFSFTGEEMERLGISGCVSDVCALEEKFCRLTGIRPAEIATRAGATIYDFFNIAHFRARVQSRFSFPVSINIRGGRELVPELAGEHAHNREAVLHFMSDLQDQVCQFRGDSRAIAAALRAYQGSLYS